MNDFQNIRKRDERQNPTIIKINASLIKKKLSTSDFMTLLSSDCCPKLNTVEAAPTLSKIEQTKCYLIFWMYLFIIFWVHQPILSNYLLLLYSNSEPDIGQISDNKEGQNIKTWHCYKNSSYKKTKKNMQQIMPAPTS